MVERIKVGELMSLADYENARAEWRRRVIGLRKARRLAVGNRVSLQFESRETVLFQVYETVRAEGIIDRAALEAECLVYNELLPDSRLLSVAMQIEAPDGNALRAALQQLKGMNRHLALWVAGEAVKAELDATPHRDAVAPSQHLRFRLSEGQAAAFVRPQEPVVIKIDHPNYQAQAAIEGETRRALIEDIK